MRAVGAGSDTSGAFLDWLAATLEPKIVRDLVAKFALSAVLGESSDLRALSWRDALEDLTLSSGVRIRVRWAPRGGEGREPIHLGTWGVIEEPDRRRAPEPTPDVYVVGSSGDLESGVPPQTDWEFYAASTYRLESERHDLPRTTSVSAFRTACGSALTEAEAVNKAIRSEGRLRYLPTSSPEGELARAIRRGETLRQEFKASLRWSLKRGTMDDAVTDAALKAIASFLNSEGGDLLLGVSDDGTPVGIEHDGFPSTDKFSLFLIETVRERIQKDAPSLLDLQFVRLQGKDICVVKCCRSRRPVWLRLKGDPRSTERFYMRTSASSVELAPSDAHRYIESQVGSKRIGTTRQGAKPGADRETIPVAQRAGTASPAEPSQSSRRTSAALTPAERKLVRHLTDVTASAVKWRTKAARFAALWREVSESGFVTRGRILEVIAPLLSGVKARGQFLASYSSQVRSPLLVSVPGERFGQEEVCFMPNPALAHAFGVWVSQL